MLNWSDTREASSGEVLLLEYSNQERMPSNSLGTRSTLLPLDLSMSGVPLVKDSKELDRSSRSFFLAVQPLMVVSSRHHHSH